MIGAPMPARPRTLSVAHLAIALAVLALPAAAIADGGSGYHPWVRAERTVKTVDMSAAALQARGDALVQAPQALGDWSVLQRVRSPQADLDLHENPPTHVDPARTGRTPAG